VWIVREVLRLIEKIAIGFAVAIVIALLWAAISKHSFRTDFRNTCLLVGSLAVVMGAIGRGSPFERRMDYGIAEQAWGRIPGVSTLKFNPEDPTLTAGAVFVGSGLALLTVAIFVL
jgi:hypothetical protein